VGPDEVTNGQVAVKNLVTGDQIMVRRGSVTGEIRKILERLVSEKEMPANGWDSI
jgi:histidyl-tRNA synthetase